MKRYLIIVILLCISCTNETKSTSIANTHPYSAELFDRLKTNRDFTIKGLFQSYKSPYPGSLTHEISCPEEFHPKHFTFSNAENKFDGYILFSNKRKVYGSCRVEDNVYRVFDGAVHCIKQNTIMEIKWYAKADVPLEKFKQQIEESHLCQ